MDLREQIPKPPPTAQRQTDAGSLQTSHGASLVSAPTCGLQCLSRGDSRRAVCSIGARIQNHSRISECCNVSTNGRREPYRTGTVLAQGQRGGAQICRYEDAEHGHCHRRHPPANVAASGSAASHSPAGRLYWEISRGFSTFRKA